MLEAVVMVLMNLVLLEVRRFLKDQGEVVVEVLLQVLLVVKEDLRVMMVVMVYQVVLPNVVQVAAVLVEQVKMLNLVEGEVVD